MGTGKKVLLIVGIIAAVLIIGLVAVYISVTSSPTLKAQIHVEAGQVLVNGNPITGDGTLKQGDVIETKADGQATVILYESVLISLDENTKVTLDDLTQQHPKVSQEGGETWNKFTKLSGVEDYSVSSGNSVASVRGTAFAVKGDKIVTGEGEVQYDVDGKSYRVLRNRVVERLNGTVKERDANQGEKDDINRKGERIIKMLKFMREKEIQKHPRVAAMIKARLGVDDAGLKELLEKADNGEFDIDEVAKQSPVRIESINKVSKITAKIREIRQAQLEQNTGLINQTLNALNQS